MKHGGIHIGFVGADVAKCFQSDLFLDNQEPAGGINPSLGFDLPTVIGLAGGLHQREATGHTSPTALAGLIIQNHILWSFCVTWQSAEQSDLAPFFPAPETDGDCRI